MGIARRTAAVLAAGAGVLALTGCGSAAGGPAADAGAAAPTRPAGVLDGRVRADTLGASPSLPAKYGTPPAAPPTVTPAPRCPAPGPQVTASQVDAAMGLRALTLTLTNCGDTTLTVRGYPDLVVLDAAGNPLRVTVHHGVTVTTGIPDPGPVSLTLRPGGQAVAVLAWRNTVTDATVTATTGAAFAVTAPGATAPQVVRETLDVGTTGRLDTTAWHRASGR